MTDTTRTTPAFALQAGTWTLDRPHSRAGFTIRHLGITNVRGAFTAVDATVTVGELLADTAVEAVVDMASIDTGIADRDTHLRSADLLDVVRRPTMTYRSTAVTAAADDGWLLEGLLTYGEVTRTVALDVELGGVEVNPSDGRRHAGFDARGELRREDIGLDFGPLVEAGLGQVVKVQLDLELVAPA